MKARNPTHDRRAAVILRIRAIAERSLALSLHAELLRASKAFASAHADRRRRDAAYAEHRQRLERLYTAHFMQLARQHALLDLKAPKQQPTTKADAPAGQPKLPQPDARPDTSITPSADAGRMTEQEIHALVISLAVASSVTTANGTRRKVEETIAHGIANGLSAAEIAQQIEQETGGEVAGARALAIARTATTGVSSAATQAAAAKIANVQQKDVTKTWWTALDNRVRPTHAEAHGQTVPLDSAFTVGDSRLMFPGDPLGPPEEVINCRCVLLYHGE